MKNIEKITRRLADDGLLLESGWVGLRLSVLPPNAPEVQIREMRKAFFAGAQHLFSSVLSFLEEGEDPTPKDLHRLEMISVELDAFVDSLKREARGIVDP